MKDHSTAVAMAVHDQGHHHHQSYQLLQIRKIFKDVKMYATE